MSQQSTSQVNFQTDFPSQLDPGWALAANPLRKAEEGRSFVEKF